MMTFMMMPTLVPRKSPTICRYSACQPRRFEVGPHQHLNPGLRFINDCQALCAGAAAACTHRISSCFMKGWLFMRSPAVCIRCETGGRCSLHVSLPPSRHCSLSKGNLWPAQSRAAHAVSHDTRSPKGVRFQKKRHCSPGCKKGHP